MIVGSGKFRYRVNADWAKLPAGWSFKEVGGVGVDRNDNVYVFNRGEHPMMVFDREGNFLRSWGEGQYPRAHGVHMAPDDTMFLTDDGGHFVRKVTLDGKVLLELGVPGKPAPYMSGEPFHRCTHTALSPQGHIYVSDGYGNSRVHKYTPDGKLLMSWGEPAPVKASSTSSTTSAVTPMVGSTSPTVRTTGCRSSTATVSSRPNGRTCTARVASACPMAISRFSTSAKSVLPLP
ncbi:MAG TPA: hypothetical protein VJ251_09860 [Stellaceae bacterium]|nr:hypothetical protein [Stellaceae bacterium]